MESEQEREKSVADSKGESNGGSHYKIPVWAWATMATTASFAMILLAGFFNWLGDTVVEHGEHLSAMAQAIKSIDEKLEDKEKDEREFQRVTVKMEVLEKDAENRKKQVDELRERLAELEKTVASHIVKDEVPSSIKGVLKAWLKQSPLFFAYYSFPLETVKRMTHFLLLQLQVLSRDFGQSKELLSNKTQSYKAALRSLGKTSLMSRQKFKILTAK